MIRCFVAVDIPDSVRTRLKEAQDALRALALPLRFSDPSGIHLTLKFLGNRDESEIGRIRESLEGIAPLGTFEARIEGLGVFPNLRAPRIVWAGANPAEPLAHLQSTVEASLDWTGTREDRPFHPHLTLARVKESRGLGRLSEYIKGNAVSFEAGIVQVDRFHLYQSLLGASGSTYVKLGTFPLS